MLRGVNRRIIEVNDIESPFFERAILFVRPDCEETAERRLHSRAVDWLAAASTPPAKAAKRKRRISRRALWLLLWLAAAGAAALGLLYIMK